MDIIIDGQTTDSSSVKLSITCFDAARLTDTDAARNGRRTSFVLPRTPRNDHLLSHPYDLHTGRKFNDAPHRATIVHEGATLIEGAVRLTKVTDRGYHLEIRAGDGSWATRAAQTPLAATRIDFSMPLTPTDIENGWTDNTPVKFFPVARDRYPDAHNPDDMKTTQQLLTIDDYHPFIRLSSLVERIFADAGYHLRSSFLTSSFFRSLYMSGAYPSRNTAALTAKMGFKASRTADVTANASEAGMVYADPKRAVNSLGNFADTASPYQHDDEGRPKSDLYNNGGCFAIRNREMVYTPTTTVTASFVYHIKYTTSHRILSRRQLRGFDSAYLGPGTRLQFTLPNRYEDRRTRFRADYQYRVIVFDHRDGDSYVLTTRKGNGPDHAWASFSSRSASVISPAE